MSAYAVVWDGVNDGRDGDLLNRALAIPRKVIPKREPPPTYVPHTGQAKPVLWRALLQAGDRFQTRWELTLATKIGEQTVYTIVHRWMAEGRLERQIRTSGGRRYRRRQVWEFRIAARYRMPFTRDTADDRERNLSQLPARATLIVPAKPVSQVVGPPVRHEMAGFINPRCRVCGKTPMEVQRDPGAPCVTPAKAAQA